MHHQSTCVPADSLDPDDLAGAVLSLLIIDQPGLQTPDELARKLAGLSGDLQSARRQADDALADLAAHGLVHRLEGFVLPSQAAIRSQALTG